MSTATTISSKKRKSRTLNKLIIKLIQYDDHSLVQTDDGSYIRYKTSLITGLTISGTAF